MANKRDEFPNNPSILLVVQRLAGQSAELLHSIIAALVKRGASSLAQDKRTGQPIEI